MTYIKLISTLSLMLACIQSSAVVFEKDQRSLVNSTDSKISELAKSVFTFIPKSKLIRSSDGSFEFTDRASLKTTVNLCEDERFADVISVGTRCSGSLISPSLGLTAGHCVSPEFIPDFCANYYIIFDYIQNGTQPISKLAEESVHECSRIKKMDFSSTVASDDYAILEFSKPIVDRKPLNYRKTGKIKNGQGIFMLGHPRGLPQVLSKNRNVLQNDDPSFFATDLDCFHGNSGSPVFNKKTHLIEGIFVRGEGYMPNQSSDPNLVGDFYLDSSLGCNRTLVCKRKEDCTAVMQATRTTRIQL